MLQNFTMIPPVSVVKKKRSTNFLSLPAELRNYIYDLSGCLRLAVCGGMVLVGDFPELHEKKLHSSTSVGRQILLVGIFSASLTSSFTRMANTGVSNAQDHRDYVGAKAGAAIAHNGKRLREPPLATGSKQVRSETLSSFYGNMPLAFCFWHSKPVYDDITARVFRWLEDIGPDAASMLRDVNVEHEGLWAWRGAGAGFRGKRCEEGLSSRSPVGSVRSAFSAIDKICGIEVGSL